MVFYCFSKLFEIIWNKESDIVVSNKIEILERIEKILTCAKVINESLKLE